MKREHIEVQPDDFAKIWQDAQLRRSADFGFWLKQWLQRRQQADRQKPAPSPAGRNLATG
jgi:hypothetical protein